MHGEAAQVPALPWRDRVQVLASELRAELLAHPGAVHLVLGDSLNGPIAQAVGLTLLAILADAGLAPADVAHLLNVHILGSVAVQLAEPTDNDTTRFHWGLDRLLDGLAAHATRFAHTEQ
ncbi:TetR/AcrR family transcriptional regulator C-terminal domain-containing protein [Actinocrispum sp. NPDC049592]|uniref:TetR/AcrR family transcriptional regulator C-terminal domain-containing protein n=1 Tax=Actinocrispum sp. NPDC049592 TaxID=3154835 RepID=UPI00343407EF